MIMCRLVAWVLVILVVMPGLVFGQLAVWDAGGKSPRWDIPENWDTDKVPTINDAVAIDLPDVNCVIDEGVDAKCMALDVANLTKQVRCGLEIRGGSLTSAGYIRVANPVDTNGIMTITGGTVNTSNKGRLQIGMNNRSYGVVIIRGGEVTASDKVEIGKNTGATGYLYIEGGTLNVAGYGSDDFELATYGTGYVYMTGGELRVTDQIKLAQGSASNSNGKAYFYLYGGTVTASNLRSPADTYGKPYMDITDGRLILAGDDTATVNDYVGRGWLVGYGGIGKVVATYDPNLDQTIVTATRPAAEYAWAPTPANLSEVEMGQTGIRLSWRPGKYAAAHRVYFGQDKDAVAQADASGTWPQYKGQQTQTSLNVGQLELGTTYYWRVDEVNDNPWAPAGSPWKGDVWQFTVANYIVLDDMESYGDLEQPGPPPAPGSRIWYTWRDGAGWTMPSPVQGNGTGSVVDPNRGVVHSGSQSLKIYYDNDGTNMFGQNTAFYSEVTVDLAHLAIGRDWTRWPVKALSLWFYGNAANTLEQSDGLYIKINGVKVAYDGPAVHLQEAKWHEWNIDLTRLGVDLRSVLSLAIGIGNPASPTSGGSGIIYVDDIRLYLPRCMPQIVKPVGDLDSDCDVDMEDLALLAQGWLQRDYIDRGSDGILRNFASQTTQWIQDPDRGRGLQLDGVDDWVDLDDAMFGNFHDRTIAVWVRISEFPETYPYVFSFQNAASAPYRIYIRTRGTDSVRVHFVEDYSPDLKVGKDVWRHIAFVLRDTPDGLCTGELYGDGLLIGKLAGRPRHLGAARSVSIGCFGDGSSGFIKATYDDFRIYARALSPDEVAALAQGAGPVDRMMVHYRFDETSGLVAANSSSYKFARPLLVAGELYTAEPEGSRVVNLLDFALLAKSWGAYQLWP